MTKDNALQILNIMYRLTVILFACSTDLEVSVYNALADCQTDINTLFYQIKESD